MQPLKSTTRLRWTKVESSDSKSEKIPVASMKGFGPPLPYKLQQWWESEPVYAASWAQGLERPIDEPSRGEWRDVEVDHG